MTAKTKNLATGKILSCITVSDFERARKLFVDILGFQVKDFQKEENWMEIGNQEESLIGIGQSSKEMENCGMSAGSNAIISIDVENLEESISFLKSCDHEIKFIGEIIEVAGQVKMILFEDFDGNRFFLCETLNKESLSHSAIDET